MKLGLKYCIDHNFRPVELEIDSLSLKKIIEGSQEVPWSIAMEVKRIKNLINIYQMRVMHVFREGNQFSDFFTNFIFSFVGTGKFQFRSIHGISNKEKSIINLKRCNMTNIYVINIKIEGKQCTQESRTTSTIFISNG